MLKLLTNLAFVMSVLCLSCELAAQGDVAPATQTAKLRALSEELGIRDSNDRQKAREFAQRLGIPLRRELPSGGLIELQRIAPGIGPIFYITNNVDAADTVSTDEVWPGGSAGLDLDGSDLTVAEWDGGAIFADHPDFTGRLTQVDGVTLVSNHSTHVAGTLIGSGEWLLPESRGMAYAAHLNAYDWNSDTAEMALAASNGRLVSNHSYGIAAGWLYLGGAAPDTWWWIGGSGPSDVEDPNFGYYDSETQLWDQIAFDAPYYLIVKAAGNDRSDIGPAPGEEYTVIDQDGNFLFTSTLPRNADCAPAGYDCMPGSSVAKNVLTVGAVDDLIGGYSPFSGPSSVQMADFSDWGPTDDGRIKPDVVGNGIFLLSAWGDDPFYAAAAGTSMSAPNVTGSLLLLQEHYNPNPTAIGYAPDMMRYDGVTGYYDLTGMTTAGNKVSAVARIRTKPSTGGASKFIVRVNGPTNKIRLVIAVVDSDHATVEMRNKLQLFVQDSAGVKICRVVSTTTVTDDQLHTVFASYDGDTGSATLYIDGVNADDLTNPARTLSTGTLEAGASSNISVGSSDGGAFKFSGEIGYAGHVEDYLTNWSDFMDVEGNPKELDETTWTEWGAQPLFWNADGDMEVNAGSAGNMTRNGTVTPVGYPTPYSTDNFMRAATLKALAIHTADEAGAADGPDFEFGWGLLNTKAAAQVITENGGAHQIIEDSLLESAVDAVEIIVSEADTRITATLVWADPPGTPVAPTLDPPDLMLVNDLDLRIEHDASIYMPWILNPAAPADAATTGDNFRDNVEQVVVDASTVGSYFIEVSHKGALLDGASQAYSLIISVEPRPPTGSDFLIYEEFSAGMPAGWTVETIRGADWTIQAPIPGDSILDNQTGGSGNFAIVNNDFRNTDTSLRTPALDLSSTEAVVLRFKSYFYFDTYETINVDVSTDGGSGWTNVWSWAGFNPFPTNYVLDITDQAAGQPNVTLRFRYDSEGVSQGVVWQIDDVELEVFGGEPPPGDTPGPASNPSPADAANGVSVVAILSWTAGTDTDSHDVYFGTDPTPDAGEFQGNQGGAAFNPGGLLNSTTYYWRIDEVNTEGTTSGDVWSFTTEAAPILPGPAGNPSPADTATAVSTITNLSWTAGAGTDSHDVYFGTDASPDAGEFQGNQGGLSFDPGTLANTTTYYWRIDEVNGSGTTVGPVWSFTTEEIAVSAFHIAGIVVVVELVKGPRNKGVATITVHDSGGLPVAGVALSGTFSGDWNGTRSGTTDGSGQLVVETPGVKNGSSWDFCIDTASKTGWDFDEAGSAAWLCGAPPPPPTTGSIAGVVTDIDTGLPIEGASVSTDSGQNDTTVAGGNYSLTSVPTGARLVTVSAGGYDPDSQSTTVSDGVTSTLNFELTPSAPGGGTGSLKGTVKSASGAKLSGVLVQVHGGPAATTNKSGRYTILDVAEGDQNVTASLSGFVDLTKAVTIPAGSTATLNFDLSPD